MGRLSEQLAVIGLVVMVVMVLISWPDLPSRVPTHYGLSGPPNGFGSKTSLLLLPVIAVVSYAGLTFLSRFPQIFNYPVKVTQANAKQLHQLGLGLLGWTKAEVIWIFAFLEITSIQVALGKSSGLSIVFLPLTLGVVIATTVFYFRRMRQLA